MTVLLAGGIYDGRRIEVEPEAIEVRMAVPRCCDGHGLGNIIASVISPFRGWAIYRRPNQRALVAFHEASR